MSSSPHTAPETSIVIRAFNEERWLPEVLRAIERQTNKDFEIILVDSGSTDRTRDIAGAASARIVRLRPDNFTFGHSLNLGIQEARGAFVAMVSAHAIPTDEHWLERLIAPLRGGNAAMVFGGQTSHAVSKFSEARDFERMYPAEPRELDDPEYIIGNNANSAIRRDLWESFPFDEGLPGLEDIGWASHWIEQGKAVLYEPAACIYHVHAETWRQVRQRYHREGIAARWVGIKVLRHIPREIWRETSWLVRDLWVAALQGRITRLFDEIARFRYNKLLGTITGIVDSRGFTNPAKRSQLYFEHTYPALVIRGPHDAAVEERTVPSLKPGEVLVRVAYQGICATDLEIFEGRLGYYKSGIASYPIVPGHECSGTIAAFGTKVTDVNEGDRVVVECIQGCGECASCERDLAIRCRERREVGVIGKDGGYAAYLVCHSRYVHRVPENVTLAQAALVEPLAVVIKALRRLGASAVGESKRCAVIGAGTIGQLAARVLSSRGHQVTVIDREIRRLESLDAAITTSTDLTGLDRFDWLVEATGDQAALAALLQESATGATILLMGLPYAHDTFSFESIVGFDRTVVGSVGSSGADFEEALATLARLDLTPFLRAAYPFEQYERAWNDVRARLHLKVMLQIDPTAA